MADPTTDPLLEINRPQMRATPGTPLNPIMPRTEAPLLHRLGAGFRISEQGKLNYYAGLYGKENTGVDKAGNIMIRQSPDEPWRMANKPGFTAGDVAEYVAPLGVDVAATALNPLAGAPRLGMRMAGSGLTAGGGALARNLGVSPLLPGDPGATAGEIAADVGMSMAGAAGGDVLSAGLTRLRPTEAAKRFAQNRIGKMSPAERVEARRASEITPLTPGQFTGDRGTLMLEGMLRRHPGSSQIMKGMDEQQLRDIWGRMGGLLDRVADEGLSSEALGARIGQTFDDLMGNLRNVRSTNARRLFNAPELKGAGPVIPADETARTIDSLIDEFDSKLVGAPEIVSKLKSMRGAVTNAAGDVAPQTPQEIQKAMSLYGQMLQGAGVWKDIDRGQQRAIAARLMRALEADLDNATEAGLSAPAASALRTARSQYKIDSQAINEIRDSVIGRMMGRTAPGARSPERIAEGFMRMRPGEVRNAMRILGQESPEFVQTVKRSALEQAMERSVDKAKVATSRIESTPLLGAADDAWSPAKLLSALKDTNIREVLDADESMQLGTIMRSLERVANREGEGSPTAGLQWAMEIMSHLATGGAQVITDPRAVARTFGSLFAARNIAKVLADPDGRKALLNVTAIGTKQKPRLLQDSLSKVFSIAGVRGALNGAATVPIVGQAGSGEEATSGAEAAPDLDAMLDAVLQEMPQ